MIINLETKQVQTQSIYPNTNWIGDGWVVVPAELEEKALRLSPFCILNFDGDVLVNIEDDTEAREEHMRDAPEPPPDPLADLATLVIDLTYRQTLSGLEVK